MPLPDVPNGSWASYAVHEFSPCGSSMIKVDRRWLIKGCACVDRAVRWTPVNEIKSMDLCARPHAQETKTSTFFKKMAHNEQSSTKPVRITANVLEWIRMILLTRYQCIGLSTTFELFQFPVDLWQILMLSPSKHIHQIRGNRKVAFAFTGMPRQPPMRKIEGALFSLSFEYTCS